MKPQSTGVALGLCLVLVGSEPGWAGEEAGKDHRVVDQIGTSAKKVITTIEKEVTGVVKKLEESETPKKVGQELKRSLEALGEQVEQAGKKVKEQFRSE